MFFPFSVRSVSTISFKFSSLDFCLSSKRGQMRATQADAIKNITGIDQGPNNRFIVSFTSNTGERIRQDQKSINSLDARASGSHKLSLRTLHVSPWHWQTDKEELCSALCLIYRVAPSERSIETLEDPKGDSYIMDT